jgi:cyanate permease
MNATTTNRAQFAGAAPVTSPEAATDYLRHAQNAFLTELPGVVFGIVTLAYLATALLRLA